MPFKPKGNNKASESAGSCFKIESPLICHNAGGLEFKNETNTDYITIRTGDSIKLYNDISYYMVTQGAWLHNSFPYNSEGYISKANRFTTDNKFRVDIASEEVSKNSVYLASARCICKGVDDNSIYAYYYKHGFFGIDNNMHITRYYHKTLVQIESHSSLAFSINADNTSHKIDFRIKGLNNKTIDWVIFYSIFNILGRP